MKIIDCPISEIESLVNFPIKIEFSNQNFYTYLNPNKEILIIEEKLKSNGFFKIQPYSVCCKIKILYPFLEKFPSGMIVFIKSEDFNKLFEFGIIKKIKKEEIKESETVKKLKKRKKIINYETTEEEKLQD